MLSSYNMCKLIFALTFAVKFQMIENPDNILYFSPINHVYILIMVEVNVEMPLFSNV